MFVSRLARPLLAWLALASITIAADSDTITSTSTSEPRTTSSATRTSSSTGIATHTIQVGPKSDPHQFVPSEITANAGDLVVFEFYPTNHSAVKAEFNAPCVPASKDLFSSGIFNEFNQENGQLIGPPPTWSVRINDTEPTFFYCTAIDSCTKNGMVGAINPNSTQSWKAQYQKALVYPYMLVPGQSAPPEGEGSSSGGSDDNKSSDDNNSSDEKNSGGGGLSKGAIAGIAVACVVFVGILIALFFVLGRNRVYSQWMSSEDGRTERTARWAMFNHNQDHSHTKSEAGTVHTSVSKPGHINITAAPSPNPTMGTFSPNTGVVSGPGSPTTQQGHWSWNEPPQNARASAPVNPMELEGHPIIWEAPGSTPHHRG